MLFVYARGMEPRVSGEKTAVLTLDDSARRLLSSFRGWLKQNSCFPEVFLKFC